MTAQRSALLGDYGWVTDGGLETDLLFNRGVDLPHFAAFPLLEEDDGRAVLERYYAEYADIASAAAAGLVLETPTWRANPDWAARLGYDAAALDVANRRAVELVRSVGARAGIDRILLSGVVGPRGDGYVAADPSPDDAAEYHSAQVDSFARAGVDFVHAMTMTGPAEAIGIVKAARAAGVAVAISFTVETDGRLPDGTSLPDAFNIVDAIAAPDWYGVNCAHPTHLLRAFEGVDATTSDSPPAEDWRARIAVLRPNASTRTHQELDESTVLDTGDPDLLVASADALRKRLPTLQIVGGCCGTDSTHVAALWGTPAPDRRLAG